MLLFIPIQRRWHFFLVHVVVVLVVPSSRANGHLLAVYLYIACVCVGNVCYLAWVSGIIVGGFGGCCGTIRPRRVVDRICGNEMSPADLSDMMPVPLLTSSLFECDV